MIPLEDDDLFMVYLHIPSKRVIGLTPAMNGELIKVQLEPSVQPKWGNINLWTKGEKDIFHNQCMKGEIEMLKAPPNLDPGNFNCQGPVLG